MRNKKQIFIDNLKVNNIYNSKITTKEKINTSIITYINRDNSFSNINIPIDNNSTIINFYNITYSVDTIKYSIKNGIINLQFSPPTLIIYNEYNSNQNESLIEITDVIKLQDSVSINISGSNYIENFQYIQYQNGIKISIYDTSYFAAITDINTNIYIFISNQDITLPLSFYDSDSNEINPLFQIGANIIGNINIKITLNNQPFKIKSTKYSFNSLQLELHNFLLYKINQDGSETLNMNSSLFGYFETIDESSGSGFTLFQNGIILEECIFEEFTDADVLTSITTIT